MLPFDPLAGVSGATPSCRLPATPHQESRKPTHMEAEEYSILTLKQADNQAMQQQGHQHDPGKGIQLPVLLLRNTNTIKGVHQGHHSHVNQTNGKGLDTSKHSCNQHQEKKLSSKAKGEGWLHSFSLLSRSVWSLRTLREGRASRVPEQLDTRERRCTGQ